MLEFNSAATASSSLSFVSLLLTWEEPGVPEAGIVLSVGVDVNVGENSLCERLGKPINLRSIFHQFSSLLGKRRFLSNDTEKF